jgi:hypothetical protein
MNILLKGGPCDGKKLDHGLPLPQEWQEIIDPDPDVLPRFQVPRRAIYSWGGLAVIDNVGRVQWAIFHHETTEDF